MSPDFARFQDHVPRHAIDAFNFVRNNADFLSVSASSNKHHNWDGGLAVHTDEVITISLDMAKSVPGVDLGILVVAGMWHDFGKIWAYEKVEVPDRPDVMGGSTHMEWVDTKAKHLVGGHLSRSYAEWLVFNRRIFNRSDPTTPAAFVDAVGHCILAHHGCREWGSPCTPQTKEAFILHLADSCSARLLGGENLGSYRK